MMGGQNSHNQSHTPEAPMAEFPWTAARTLLAAQNRTTKVLELYLLAYYLDQRDAQQELLRTLEGAIEDHRRIIKDLELARDAVEDT